MALQLRSGKLPAAPVLIGKGAAILIRPATSFEVSKAQSAALTLIAGLVAAENAASVVAAILGAEFETVDFTQSDWREAAAQRLALMELTWACQEGWSGVVDEAGAEIAEPSREWIAILLRDSGIAKKVQDAIQAPVHLELAEGNG